MGKPASRRKGWGWLGGQRGSGAGGGLRGARAAAPSSAPGASAWCSPSLAYLLPPASYIRGFRILNTFSGREKQHTDGAPGTHGGVQSPGTIGVPDRRVFKRLEVTTANACWAFSTCQTLFQVLSMREVVYSVNSPRS